MSKSSPSPLEQQLILETTLFQEETTPEALHALLDQLEPAPVPFSPDQEWTRFRQAHPEHFPSGPFPRVLRWVAAACLALAVALPAVSLLPQPPEEPAAKVSSAQARTVLYQLAGIAPVHTTSVRMELPFNGALVEGPARLPLDAQLYSLPFFLTEDSPPLESGLEDSAPTEGTLYEIAPACP